MAAKLEAAARASAFAGTKLCFGDRGMQAKGELQGRASAGLGMIQLDAGAAAKALETLLATRALFATAQIGMAPDHTETLLSLGRAHLQLGAVAAAVPLLAAADRFWTEFDAISRHAGLTKRHLPQARWAWGDKRAATEALRRADAPLKHSVVPADHALLRAASAQHRRVRIASGLPYSCTETRERSRVSIPPPEAS